MLPRVRRRVALRVGRGKAPEALREVWHRSRQRYAQAALDVLLIFSALDLDHVGEDRSDDPPISLPLLLPSECLAQEAQRPILILSGARDQSESAKREGLPARVLRLLRDRERARESLRRTFEVGRASCRERVLPTV